MLSTLSATESAFLMVALLQAVASLVWGAGAWAVADARAAAAHWSLWAALSSATWFLLATHLASPPLLAVACGVIGACALQRGIRIFIAPYSRQAVLPGPRIPDSSSHTSIAVRHRAPVHTRNASH